MSDEDLLQKLWESDEASALTNQAARRIEELKAREEAIVRAALERAAYYAEEVWEPLDKLLPFASKEMNENALMQERIPFDLDYFNKITKGGLPNKTLNIALAGTGVGKSLFMCHVAAAAHTGQYEAAERIAISIRALASDPAEVSAILKKAGEDRG
jgi:hypothetical protein